MNKDKRSDGTEVADEWGSSVDEIYKMNTADEKIFITGISGAFPNSGNVYEFMDNLFNKTNMLTPTVDKWDYKHPEIPEHMGCLKETNKYDAGFFGAHERQAHGADPVSRLVQERAVEAIMDAGMHPADLEHTNTGVYVGTCNSEHDGSSFVKNKESRTYCWAGSLNSMTANTLSWFLKLKGPSFTTDTACSGSFYALEEAYRALRSGEIDNAIVGGVNLCWNPITTLQFARLGVLSPDGICKVFDKDGNGYCRSEAIGVMILEKSRITRRNYCELIHVKTNCDGFKERGVTFPSSTAQRQLLKDFYNECGVDPLSLSYLEAHGTGTSVGDPEECVAIDQVFTKGRKTPLLIGSVKSNIGHTEPTSGICAIVKCIIGMETGFIPPNIHYSEPRDEIVAIKEGRMRVVAEKTPFEDNRGLIGVNSFGFGGANAHVLIRKHKKDKVNSGLPVDNLPRLLCVSGRTPEAVKSLLDECTINNFDAEHLALLHNVFRKNVPNHLYRGYSIISKSGEIERFMEFSPRSCTPLYLAFGELDHWYDIGNKLMALPPFVNSIYRIQKLVLNKGINIIDTILGRSGDIDVYHILGSVAVQIGIIDILKTENIVPTNQFGYSYGELLSGYFDGVLSLEQVVGCAVIFNEALNTIDGLSKNKIKTKNGSPKIISEDLTSGSKILGNLKQALQSNMIVIKNTMLQDLSAILDKPKVWSNKAVIDRLTSAEHFLEALSNNDTLQVGNLENNSLVLTIGDVRMETQTEDVKITSLFKTESKNHVLNLLKSLGNLYLNGYNPQLANLYPEIQYPVSRGTRMIAPYVQWKHNRKWFVPKFEADLFAYAERRSRIVRILPTDREWSFIDGHMVDGRNLFPATGYLFIVWETLAIIRQEPLASMNVVLEDCRFLTATTVPKKKHLQFNITITKCGRFEVVYGGTPVVTGKITVVEDETEKPCVETHQSREDGGEGNLALKTKDIYKELRLRGYNYRKGFRSIQQCNEAASKAYIKWENNWITFMDNMLQMSILQTDTRLLFVPTYISKLTIDSPNHINWMTKFTDDKGIGNLPVYCNPHSGAISSGHIKISGLTSSSIARKKDLRIPVLEKYVFLPNQASLQIESSVRANMQILVENSLVYKVNAVEVIDNFTPVDSDPLLPIVQTVLKDQPSVKASLKILASDAMEVSVPVENAGISRQTGCHLVVVSNGLSRPEILKEAFSVLHTKGFIISRERPDFDFNNLENSTVCVVTVHKTHAETLVLLKKSSARATAPLAVKITGDGNFDWVEKLQNVVKMKKQENVVLYAENEETSGLLGLVNCLRKEPETAGIRCFLMLDNTKKFDAEDPFFADQLNKNLAINVYKDGTWGTYRHLLMSESLERKVEHCFVKPLVKGDLASLKWVEGGLTSKSALVPDGHLIYTNYCSLNFRDVMTASGKINADVGTSERMAQDFVPGFEYSGRDIQGNRVFGMVTFNALATVVMADKYLTLAVPDGMTLQEAATIPVVYGTVIYTLIERANMQRGDSILIHSGTGGVGQAAIRVALSYGCQVFTTVGSDEKREFLKKTFPQLKDSHICSSRDTTFEQMVWRKTNGRGVNIVLNSLSDDKLIASVRCLARGGKMMELGKFDLAKNSELNLVLFEKDASFQGVMLDRLFQETAVVKSRLANYIREGLKSGMVKPLNTSVFKYDEVEKAFRFMASGKHMGKVLVEVNPEEKISVAAPRVPKVQQFPCTPRYTCDSNKTYVIAGGLGGFGLELADWLVLRGAKKLVLTSRKGAVTGYQKLRISKWLSYGVLVHTSKDDITTISGCEKMLQEANNLGPVDAVFNLAVVLADAVFENQTAENFAITFAPKAIATKNLDELSRKLCPTARKFVVFSSVTCGLGTAGQTNYGMANSIMERICELRKKEGYPALAIQWGAVGDVGIVAEMQEEDFEMEIGGTLQQAISSCLNILDQFLTQAESVIVSSIVVAEKKTGADVANSLVDAVINILGIRDGKTISLHSTLAELGMDSMTAVEIKQTMERDYEVFLNAKNFRSMTLARLKEIQEEKYQEGQAYGPSKDYGPERTLEFGLDNLFGVLKKEIGSPHPIIRLNSQIPENSSGRTVIFFPGIEAVSTALEPAASKVNAHVLCLQYPSEIPGKSLIDLVDTILPLVLEHVSKTEHFRFVSYSYGCLIALEIVHILEKRGYNGSVILIDGSPVLMKTMALNLGAQYGGNLQTGLLCHILTFYVSPEVIAKHEGDILKLKSWKERLNATVKLIEHRSKQEAESHTAIVSGIYQKLEFLISYEPTYTKLHAAVHLLKAKDTENMGLPNDYSLSDIFQEPSKIDVVEGNHATMLDSELIPTKINSWLF